MNRYKTLKLVISAGKAHAEGSTGKKSNSKAMKYRHISTNRMQSNEKFS
jgi:hypothetical protein